MVVCKAIDLGTRSVVIIARAVLSPPFSDNKPAKVGKAAVNASMRIRCPITPVEASKIASAGIPKTWLKAAALSRASCHPASPVAAFAWPALHKIALALALVCRR